MEHEIIAKQRLDLHLVEHSHFPTRTTAIAAIKQGCVSVNGKVVIKPASTVDKHPQITVIGACPWISRGGLKLDHALNHFNIDVTDAICLDLGASTGGFCDVLLSRKCQKIYAVDVGHSQLHSKIAENPKIINLEQIPAKILDDTLVPDVIDFLCIDVSFISVTKVFDFVLPLLSPTAKIVILCKPQFELNPQAIKKGMVKEVHFLEEAKEAVLAFLESRNLANIEAIDSPITGTDGNHEYLISCCNVAS
ncbi:MAG: 23S rRNA (cytidine1920-2'-O)/16S rRNA (cytidine1409-2'-O)-methyltransferase [Alphaproteobacteria bacterium]|jgi:23S rRNA (cytidine1920-2'-O)/16S rRNA (cytidine1409-2'-O)-methyltransferase